MRGIESKLHMLSVMKHTRHYVKENRLDVADLQKQVEEDTSLADATSKVSDETNRKLGTLAIQRQINLTIGQMELAMGKYKIQRRIYVEQRSKLERGY